jgi:uncharacterized protein (TIGR04255 family)
MSNWERFPDAPITEALLDIQVEFSAPVALEQIDSFHDVIRDAYPTKQSRVKWHGEIQVAQEAVQQAVKRGAHGLLFKSGDERRIVQARQDGFTFNWLKPYDGWEALRSEARARWESYRDAFSPQAITRIGLRYINRIELPIPFEDFRDYVKTAPDVAPGIPQGLSSLFMRLEIPDAERGLIAIVTETMEPRTEDGKRLPLLFDIDVVCQDRLDPRNPAVWHKLEQMREFKNEIFFSSVTEKAKEFFR